MENVRVRFAPSPTGGLHIGGVRTALFNYLFAKKNNGTFILRIEDTDKARFVEGAEEYIKDALEWCGITFDENPWSGGPFKPYRQSERKEIYQKYAQKLIDEDKAYYAFDTSEELDNMRERLKNAGMANLNYNSASRMTMQNSLTLSAEETKKRIDSGDPYVIRIKVQSKDEIRLNDMIRGWVLVHSSTLDDKVILKSDGLPTYHLANVVDDYLMKITHVIRGEEWLPSAPLHVVLYKYLGWEESQPKFAHLPLILKPDGNGKLSKRAAEKAGFPIFPLSWKDPQTNETSIGFKESGYLPEAFINFLSLLGWNSGTDQEIFTLQELEKHFTIERVGKSGTKFDIDKANWFNQQYLKNRSNSELGKFLSDELKKQYDIVCDLSYAEKICELLKTRLNFPQELVSRSLIFFEPPKHFDEKIISKKFNDDAKTGLSKFAEVIGNKSVITAEEAHEIFHETLTKIGMNPGKIMQMLRLTISGEGSGPDLMKMMEIMGGEAIQSRILHSIDTLNKQYSID